MNKAIFLDRDGTINVEKNYLYRIEDFEFLPGVVDALRQLQRAGYLLIIVTNQSGIGRGYYSEDDFLKLNDWMGSTLKEQGVTISDVYYCPHLPNAQIEKYRKICNCRKPLLGMYEQAICDHDIDLSKSYAIGDKIRDCTICERTACHGFLIGYNEKPEIIAEVQANKRERIRYADNLWGCVSQIIADNKDFSI